MRQLDVGEHLVVAPPHRLYATERRPVAVPGFGEPGVVFVHRHLDRAGRRPRLRRPRTRCHRTEDAGGVPGPGLVGGTGVHGDPVSGPDDLEPYLAPLG